MKFAKNTSKKAKQTKNLRSAEKDLETLPRNSKGELPERVLYLWPDGTFWCEFPNWSCTVAKGFTWGKSQIRFAPTPTTMCEVQLVAERHGSRSLQKNVKRGRRRIHGKTGSRQKSNSKSHRPLSKTNPSL